MESVADILFPTLLSSIFKAEENSEKGNTQTGDNEGKQVVSLSALS